MINFKLNQEVTLDEINLLSEKLKANGKLKHTRIGFPNNHRKIIFVIANNETYEFLSKDAANNLLFTVLKYPGHTKDENFKELSMAGIIGIPSDKKTKKYYDRRKV